MGCRPKQAPAVPRPQFPPPGPRPTAQGGRDGIGLGVLRLSQLGLYRAYLHCHGRDYGVVTVSSADPVELAA
jgi:hypothetical protein